MITKVIKFGGSSLIDSNNINNAIKIIQTQTSKHGVVVLSAMGGITNLLSNMANIATKGENISKEIAEVRSRHISVIKELLPPKKQPNPLTQIQLLLTELEDILQGIKLIRECSDRTRDLVLSFGERLISMMCAQLLKHQGSSAQFIDSRKLILTNSQHGNASVNFQETYKKINNIINPDQETIFVIPGFIGADSDNITTTLGRNGSDYTASLIAAAFPNSELQIWTDVDGIMSADPTQVEDAFVIENLSYQEAMEMSYFGARVIHPYTLIPAINNNIPIQIRNSQHIEYKGSLISKLPSGTKRKITGIASFNSVSLINVEGSGMLGMRGIASRVLASLARDDINIIMISQASSEHTICLALHKIEVELAVNALESELSLEIETKRIDKIDIQNDLAIIAIIGENVDGHLFLTDVFDKGASAALVSKSVDESIGKQIKIFRYFLFD